MFHPQATVTPFKLAFVRFSTEAYNSTLRYRSCRNWSKFGVHKRRRKTTPSERLHFTCGQLQRLTSNNNPSQLRDAPDGGSESVGCARQQSLAARNDSEVFSCTRSNEPAAQKTPKIAKITLMSRAGVCNNSAVVRRLHHYRLKHEFN